jgi:hypothetical protein
VLTLTYPSCVNFLQMTALFGRQLGLQWQVAPEVVAAQTRQVDGEQGQ